MLGYALRANPTYDGHMRSPGPEAGLLHPTGELGFVERVVLVEGAGRVGRRATTTRRSPSSRRHACPPGRAWGQAGTHAPLHALSCSTRAPWQLSGTLQNF